jgi:hypothetical protein
VQPTQALEFIRLRSRILSDENFKLKHGSPSGLAAARLHASLQQEARAEDEPVAWVQLDAFDVAGLNVTIL